MNQELLCTWLGLPKTAWPPDPWTLLGLPRDPQEASVIERHVHERMCKLRHYQLSYPEEATEGMNRLAEAFIALTETSCKVTAAPTATAPPPVQKKPAVDETTVTTKTALDWRAEPPPVRREFAETPEVIAEDEPGDEILVAKPFAPPAKPVRRKVDMKLVHDLAEQSEEATSKLATLDAVIERVDQTRILLTAWDRIGKHLKCTTKKIGPKESDAYAQKLDRIAKTMQTYPAFLGQPGKPGYRVVVQARLRMPLAMVRGMSGEQKEELLFDWQAGREVLLAHRKYLHRLFKSMRHRTKVGLVWHAIRSVVNDHTLQTLAGALVLTVAIIGTVLALK